MVVPVPLQQHEMLVELFRDAPMLAGQLLAQHPDLALPAFDEAVVASPDLSKAAPTEYRADAVVTLVDDGEPVLEVIVEVQLAKDESKRRVWPAYVGSLYERTGRPVVLVVVCATRPMTRWAAKPILFGLPDLVLRPVVFGPAEVPVVTDPAVAEQSPELAVISVLAHGGDPDPNPVFAAFMVALKVVNHVKARQYNDFVLSMLPVLARVRLEEFMDAKDYVYTSDWHRRHIKQGLEQGLEQGLAQGLAQGRAVAVLEFLDARGVKVPEDVGERISTCTDSAQLDAWIRRAATADTVEDLFQD